MPTTISRREASFSTPAAPPSGGVEITANGDDELAVVSHYETFAWNQTFTLVEPLPAPIFLNLLDAVIERERDPEIRVRAMRMATGVAEWCHDKYMRVYFGYDEPNGPPESEAASRDPREVERHLVLTSSIALEVPTAGMGPTIVSSGGAAVVTGSAEARLDAIARKIAAERGWTVARGYVEALNANPALYVQYLVEKERELAAALGARRG